jgi:hypothetical protein
MNKQGNTAEQLRALMRSHIQNSTITSHSQPTVPTQKTLVSPAPVPVAHSEVLPVPKPALAPRHSLRLLQTEISKINIIINSTMNMTGERITLTDVLRVGLGRLGEGAPISREEIDILRTTDGRRTRH